MDVVREVAQWANSQSLEPLPAASVPGADQRERMALAALGGLAGALVGARATAWPSRIRDWIRGSVAPPSELVDRVAREIASKEDVLSGVYESIVSGRNRRRLGTFFTPRTVVDFMLKECERVLPDPAVVVDPGAGVGAFSLAAKRRWPAADVVAVDVNVVTLGLLGAQSEGSVDLVLADYLSWTGGPDVPSGRPRLWVGNPPYTRHQDLPPELKKAARAAAGDLVQSGLAGLSAYFLAATIKAMAPSDALCFLLPGSWTGARYGKPLRIALRNLGRRAVDFVGFDSDLDVFPGTRVTAMVLVIGGDSSGTSQPLRSSTARLAFTGVQTTKPIEHSRVNSEIEHVGAWLWPRGHPARAEGPRLGDIAKVRRGVATGSNAFFLLTRSDRERLPASATVRAVRRLRHVVGDELTLASHRELELLGERCWLLQIDDPEVASETRVAEWLAAAKLSGVADRYLAKHRDPWYRVERIDPPDLLISPMGKRKMRVVTNEARAVPSNALYGLYLDSPSTASGIRDWLNGPEGQAALLEHARAYGADLFKLEPKDLLEIRLPESVTRDNVVDAPEAIA